MLRLADRWVWDSWMADTGTEYHLFYLQAPKSLGDPDRRHWHATVGHARSVDLVDWEVLPDALGPGPAGSWDDLAIWTGSVIEGPDGRWHLFFTGISTSDDGTVQRIGRATSTDLISWTKAPEGPVIEADPRWYELLDLSAWHQQAWRDPWVFADPFGDGYHALITARSDTGPPDARGVIGHARSADLLSWQVLPPLSAPGEFGHLEVPQVALVDGQPILVFCADAASVGSVRRERDPRQSTTGTYLCRAPSLLGPFDPRVARRIHDTYAGRLVQQRDGRWVLLGFVMDDDAGRFVGGIGDPIPLQTLDF